MVNPNPTAREQTAAKKEKWKAKLDKLNEELQAVNDVVHNAKMNQRALIQKHLDDTASAKTMLQNYVETLEEENDDLCAELKVKAAISDKRAAGRKSEREEVGKESTGQMACGETFTKRV